MPETPPSPVLPPLPERINILGVGISAVDLPAALAQIAAWVDRGVRTYVVLAPVYTLMRCHEDLDLRAVAGRAGMVTPDGMPVVVVGRWLGHRQVGRVYGPDLVLALSELSARRGYRQYYYGGQEGVPEKLAEVLSEKYPGLQVAGTCSPPFHALTEAEDQAIIRQINAAQPDIVWVGLGSPKQDVWMAEHRDQLDAPVLIGVGAAFDFLTGRVPQAPRWMQRAALEWLFRLLTEPRRLWRRYLIYNPRFVWKVLLQLTGLRSWPLDQDG